MSSIPETSTAGPDITITVDRGVLTSLVKGLLSILHPDDFHGPLAGASKTKVPVQIRAYTYVMENLGLPNHWSDFAITQTVHSVMERIPRPDYEATVQMVIDGAHAPNVAAAYTRSVKDWKQAVIDGIVDRYMGLTTEDYPEGLAPQDMPHWWQKKHPEVRKSTTIVINRVKG